MNESEATVPRHLAAAAAASARLIERCIDQAVAALQAEEARTASRQRQDLADAWLALLQQRKAWTERFPRLLHTAFEAAATEPAPPEAPARRLRPSSLTLVDDSEVTRAIETTRLAEQLASVLDRPLRELDALMSAALALPGVQPERNPLRPQIYAQTLRQLMGDSAASPTWPALWLRHMAHPLAQELETLYREQARQFTQARVQAAGYRRVAEPGGRSSRAAPLDGLPSSGAPLDGRPSQSGDLGSRGWSSGPAPLGQAAAGQPPFRQAPLRTDLSPQDLAEPQLRDFLLRGSPQASWELGPSYYAQVDAELRAIETAGPADDSDPPALARQFMAMPAVDRPARHVSSDSPLPADQWGEWAAPRVRSRVRTRLKKQARQVGQVLGLEAVRKLVNKVAEDPRLLAPVREAIVALEPSLLRLAMVSPRFLVDEQHAGRALIEQVAERSFKHNDEFTVEFQAFFHAVRQQFQALNALDDLRDAEPFAAALASLRAGWAAQDALDAEAQAPALGAVQFAEARQAEADRIAWEFSQRSDLAGVPAPVQDFVFGPWSLVLAHARLGDPTRHLDPGGYLSVVSDLLWSVKPDLTLHDPARAFVLIPQVLMKLRKGLDALGHPPDETQAFFQHLEKLHRPVLRLRARLRRQSGRELPPPAEPATPEAPAAPAPVRDPNVAWMGPRELQAAGFHGATASDFAPVSSEPATATPAADDPLTGLVEGAWVDLFTHGQWLRARLAWASSKGTLFMFVSHGGQPHSMTKRVLLKLVADQHLRRVDSEAVVPRALRKLRAAEPLAVPA